MYKLLRQYDEEQTGSHSLEEGKGGKKDANDEPSAFVEVRHIITVIAFIDIHPGLCDC
jgi:hypothetical protein